MQRSGDLCSSLPLQTMFAARQPRGLTCKHQPHADAEAAAIAFRAEPCLNQLIWFSLNVWFTTNEYFSPLARVASTVNGTPGVKLSRP